MGKTLAALTLAIPCSAFAQGLEPGQWEFTNTMTMEGMPNPQTHTLQRCVTKEESQDPERWMGNRQQPQTDCKFDLKEKSASRIRWQISCPSQKMTGTGTASFSKGKMESEQVMKGDMQGRSFEMRMKMSGRRLGPCKS